MVQLCVLKMKHWKCVHLLCPSASLQEFDQSEISKGKQRSSRLLLLEYLRTAIVLKYMSKHVTANRVQFKAHLPIYIIGRQYACAVTKPSIFTYKSELPSSSSEVSTGMTLQSRKHLNYCYVLFCSQQVSTHSVVHFSWVDMLLKCLYWLNKA